jgi:hypothetical protein
MSIIGLLILGAIIALIVIGVQQRWGHWFLSPKRYPVLMIWVRKTGMTLNSTMTLYGISTIDDALRFIFSLLEPFWYFSRLTIFMHFVSKDQRPTIFPGHTITRGAVFLHLCFCLDVSTAYGSSFRRLIYVAVYRFPGYFVLSDESLDKTTFLNALNGLLYT